MLEKSYAPLEKVWSCKQIKQNTLTLFGTFLLFSGEVLLVPKQFDSQAVELEFRNFFSVIPFFSFTTF